MMFLPARVAACCHRCSSRWWRRSLATRIEGWESDFTLSFSICVAALATWGITQLMNRNVDLLLAREENARLAVEEERNRMARDLHDILGHSLTVITVKAELAGRLMDADPDRARAEVADLERLSRDALVDVRRAVEGFRELTLPGELARAREALRSAGIEADLPGSAEDVPSDMREVFAWAVREGVTNVIRHSGATRCTVAAGRRTGRGPRQRRRERGSTRSGPATAATGWPGCASARPRSGATLLTRAVEPQGFSMAIVTETALMTTIRLLLADDQALVRGALAALLDLEADLQVVAEVGRGDEVVDAAREHRPDVALLDVEMPGLDGIAATEALRAALPEVPGADRHDVRAARLPAAGAAGRRGRVRRQGHARPPAGRRRAPGALRPARGRPRPGRRQPRHRASRR